MTINHALCFNQQEHDFSSIKLSHIIKLNNMSRYKVSYNFLHFNTPTKIVLYRLILIKISENEELQLSEVFYTKLEKYVNQLEKSYLWATDDRTEQNVLKIKEKATDLLFSKVAKHINEVAKGNRKLIFRSGFHAVLNKKLSTRKRVIIPRMIAYRRGAYNSHLAL